MMNILHWKRFAYVAVEDPTCRAAIVEILRAESWNIEVPTGGDVLQDLSDIIVRESQHAGPGLIAIDVHESASPRLTIAHRLRDLGLRVPIVLITPVLGLETLTDDSIILVTPRDAASAIRQLVS